MRLTQAGDTVAGYQLIRVVGEGPFGVVWQARDARGTPLAVKLLRPAFIQRPAGQAAFTRLLAAIRAQEAMQHDGIARLYGPLQDNQHSACGMACEFVDGRLLSDIRMPSQAGPDAKSLSVVLAWFEQLGEVLAWLHVQGIVHGNLKPSNIKLVREAYGHRIKLLDLPWSSIGLAAPAEGAPSYLAPEQLRGAPPSSFSDQWSLATLLAEVLRSARGPAGPTPLPASLSMVLQRAHHPEPAYRYTQLMEFVGALRVVRSELSMAGSGVYGPMHGHYGTYPGAYTPNPFTGAPMMPPAGSPQMPSAESTVPGATRVPPHLSGIHSVPLTGTPATPFASGVPQTGPGYPGHPHPHPHPETGASNEDASVFVPNTRHLETTLGGTLPETGEHEALNLESVSGPMPEPVISDAPADEGGGPSPMFGAPTLPAIPKGEPVPGVPSPSGDGTVSAGAWETREVGEAHSVRPDGQPGVEDEAGGPAPSKTNGDASGDRNGASPLAIDGVAIAAQARAAEAVAEDTGAPSGARGDPDLLEAASADPELEAWTNQPRNDTIPLSHELDSRPASGRWWPTVLVASLLVLAVAGAAFRYSQQSTPADRGSVAGKGEAGQDPNLPNKTPPSGTEGGADGRGTVSGGGDAGDEAAGTEDGRPPKPVEPLRRGGTRVSLSPAQVAATDRARKPPTANDGEALAAQRGPRGPAPDGASDAGAEDALPEEIEDAQVGCDEGDGLACLQVARYFRDVPNPRAAEEAAKRACNFGRGAGCLAAGRILSSRPKVALSLFDKGCKQKSAEACYEAGQLVRVGAGTRRSPSRAARFAKRACRLGHQPSCAAARTTTSTGT